MYYVFLQKGKSIIHIMDDYIMKDYFKENSILDYVVLFKDEDFLKCLEYVLKTTKG